MSEIIRGIKNYPMSEDYALLWSLAQQQGIVCEVDYNFYRDDSPPVRDIAQTLFRGGNVAICARGTCYIEESSQDEFIRLCKRYNLKFILPSICLPNPNYYKAKMAEVRTLVDTVGTDQALEK
jgi:hypothetical protein